ncbi:hypothetical protein C0Q70_08638 [Pomacea canaliculata]|uniref:Uncharacterized protein n=1 Tax=Pomacea canaliculata TaxID=400727 RepID=A0A2T7P7I4_POMCA|nr:hypothetical protein C0Q70_08638 [Pomacea canaliculata]
MGGVEERKQKGDDRDAAAGFVPCPGTIKRLLTAVNSREKRISQVSIANTSATSSLSVVTWSGNGSLWQLLYHEVVSEYDGCHDVVSEYDGCHDVVSEYDGCHDAVSEYDGCHDVGSVNDGCHDAVKEVSLLAAPTVVRSQSVARECKGDNKATGDNTVFVNQGNDENPKHQHQFPPLSPSLKSVLLASFPLWLTREDERSSRAVTCIRAHKRTKQLGVGLEASSSSNNSNNNNKTTDDVTEDARAGSNHHCH